MNVRIIGHLTKPLLAGIIWMLGMGAAQAGNIYLTGHDVLLHGGQNSYDNVILDFLRNNDEPAGDYDIGFVRGFSGSVGNVGVTTLEGFGSITTRDLTSFTGSADFTMFLGGVDVLVIPSHNFCGGCDLTTADADILEGFASEIASFFNAGGDIYANSGSTDATFYNFLPPGAVASGLAIGGSSGFTATADGAAIGIVNNMINGFPTHNRFVGFDPAFTVFEDRGEEIISIGILDAVITDDGIVTDDGGTDDGGTVPEPGTLALFGLGVLGLGFMRRRCG